MVGLLLACQKSRDMRSCFSSSKTWDLLTDAYLLTHPPDVMMFPFTTMLVFPCILKKPGKTFIYSPNLNQ